MNYTESLKKNYQFRKVYNKGKSIANRYLVMYILKNDDHLNRLGVSVSKKVGKSVLRSRVTRLIKENYRILEKSGQVKAGYDIVFIARVQSKDANFYDIGHSLTSLLKKHHLFLDLDL